MSIRVGHGLSQIKLGKFVAALFNLLEGHGQHQAYTAHLFLNSPPHPRCIHPLRSISSLSPSSRILQLAANEGSGEEARRWNEEVGQDNGHHVSFLSPGSIQPPVKEGPTFPFPSFLLLGLHHQSKLPRKGKKGNKKPHPKGTKR